MRTVSKVLVTDTRMQREMDTYGLHIRRVFFFTSSSRPNNKLSYTTTQKYLAGLLFLPHNVQPRRSEQM
jgi:hypothetical protein